MSGRVVIVTAVGAAPGSRPAAAALACVASDSDRSALLVDLGEARPPRPSPIATAAARRLEERLAVHLPDAGVASRGRFCHLSLPSGPEGIEQVSAALPIVRDAVAVLHLPPGLLQPVLGESLIRPTAALLRTDLRRDRALTALAAAGLTERNVRVAVLKHPLGWIAARLALLGAAPGGGGLPGRVAERLVGR